MLIQINDQLIEMKIELHFKYVSYTWEMIIWLGGDATKIIGRKHFMNLANLFIDRAQIAHHCSIVLQQLQINAG